MDKLCHYLLLASGFSYEGRKEKRSKSGGQNQSIANTAQMVTKVDTIDMSANTAQQDMFDSVEEKWVVYMQYIKEGEGYCSGKNNA